MKISYFLLLLSFINLNIFANPEVQNTNQEKTKSFSNRYIIRPLAYAALCAAPVLGFAPSIPSVDKFVKQQSNPRQICSSIALITSGPLLFIIGALALKPEGYSYEDDKDTNSCDEDSYNSL